MRQIIEQVAESFVAVTDDSFESGQCLPANLQEGYRYFLSLCDGGYTKDRLFHFFGRKGPQAHNLLEWNRPDLWKRPYGMDDKTFVFAEDIFGTQFCFDVRGNRKVVKLLIPDGGKFSLCANTFEEFLETEVLSGDSNVQARKFASRFFATNEQPFRPFCHIACKIPSSLGGDDTDLNNRELVRASTNMKLLGQITEQIKNLPSGTRIRDVRIDRDKEQVVLVPEFPR